MIRAKKRMQRAPSYEIALRLVAEEDLALARQVARTDPDAARHLERAAQRATQALEIHRHAMAVAKQQAVAELRARGLAEHAQALDSGDYLPLLEGL